MNESFDIPVTFKDKELNFAARLVHTGYAYKFIVDINGVEVFFEKDDEGNYRAIADTTKIEESNKLDINLLQAIATSLEEMLR